MNRYLFRLCLAVLVSISWASRVSAEVAVPSLPRLSRPVSIDGDLSDPAWSEALTVRRFYEISPGDNVEPPAATVGYLAYDSRYLYVGFRCDDPNPASIRAPFVERDRVRADQDFVQVDMDTRDEGRSSLVFRVNPRGVQTDSVFDEAVGADDYSPDFQYESAARITAGGWTAEMRIPVSVLRYPAADPQTWRVTLSRIYPRSFRHQMASAPVPRGSNCWLCHSLRVGGVAGLPQGGSAVIAPYLSGGGTVAGEPLSAAEAAFDGGLDIKWLPRPSLSVDLAVNPDFSQVESDVTQLAVNDRFALFYPEKRPFFLEGVDLLASAIPVVHTRSITNPDWGARLTGRPGDTAFTVLVTEDRGGGSVILPGPDSSSLETRSGESLAMAGRYRRAVGRSFLGMLVTGREEEEGSNRVAGPDFLWRPTDHDRVTGQLLWSTTTDPEEGGRAGHAVHLDWERSQSRLWLAVGAEDLDRDFRADNGFVPQVGVRKLSGKSGWAFYPKRSLRYVRPEVLVEDVQERGGGTVSRSLAWRLFVDGKWQGWLEWHPADRGRALDGRVLEQGFWAGSIRFLPGRKFPYLRFTARHGEEIDLAGSRIGTGASLSVQATVSPIDRLQAEIVGTWRRLDAGGEPVFEAQVTRAKVTHSFTSRTFARVIGELQEVKLGSSAVRSVRSSFTGSALYGYRLNWQSILYLGYGDDRILDGPSPSGARRKAVFLKVSYAFQR